MLLVLFVTERLIVDLLGRLAPGLPLLPAALDTDHRVGLALLGGAEHLFLCLLPSIFVLVDFISKSGREKKVNKWLASVQKSSVGRSSHEVDLLV